MDERDLDALDEDEDGEAYAKLDELEKLETIIMLMEELSISTLDEARARFETLERTIDTEA
jgi:hypothetical protein